MTIPQLRQVLERLKDQGVYSGPDNPSLSDLENLLVSNNLSSLEDLRYHFHNIKMPESIQLIALDIDGVLTDGGLYYSNDGEHSKKFNVKDGMAIQKAIKHGVEVIFISAGRMVDLVAARAKDIGITDFYVGQEPKEIILEKALKDRNINPKHCVYMGDDINDIPALRLAGFSACPADAVRKVRSNVDLVLSKKGGDGCVRELIEDILEIF